MAHVILYGVGWSQRWQVADGAVAQVSAEVNRVGRAETGHIPVLDPDTDEPATVAVAWQHIAAAVVLGSEGRPTASEERSGGLYR